MAVSAKDKEYPSSSVVMGQTSPKSKTSKIRTLAALLLPLQRIKLGTVAGAEGVELPVSSEEPSVVPLTVAEDAFQLAARLYGKNKTKQKSFRHTLLAAYVATSDKDFVVCFNSGGWGITSAQDSPGGLSILSGIESELEHLHYKYIALNYLRTPNTLLGRLDELKEQLGGHSSKGIELASWVKFLTDHNPNIKVVLLAESDGGVICDGVMELLKGNPRVYTIQTGPPPWHRSTSQERTLRITNNGITPDSFSAGDFRTIIRATLRAWLGFAKPEEYIGRILNRVRAPGHDYWWQYPAVRSQIVTFLNENFGAKQE